MILMLWVKILLSKTLYELEINGEHIIIREPVSTEDYRRLMDVQLRIWVMPDYSEAVTYHALIAAHRNGGVVIGAFKENGEAVGVVYSFPGYENGMVYLYSHLTGVVPDKRYRGLGYYLKLAQRKLALEKGYSLVKWTFDPLRSSNAYFNIAKLGVIVKSFYPDYYGELQDELNRGMPSDRLIAEWRIKSKRVTRVLDEGMKATVDVDKLWSLKPYLVNKVEVHDDKILLSSYELDASNDLVVVEIPGDIEPLRREDPDEVLRWRKGLREIMDYYLNKHGYVIIGYTVARDKPLRGYYILWRRNPAVILDGIYPWS